MGRGRGCIDTVAGGDGGNEDHGAPEFDIDTAGATDDLTTENVLEPGGCCLRIGTAQMNVVPGHYRHTSPPMMICRAARGGLNRNNADYLD
jgi:hypothetical protein